MRPYICLSIVLLCLNLSACNRTIASVQSIPTTAPNVIIIITDDQGYGDLSCHGNPYLETPHLDTLFSQSARLGNFHVNPTCSPSRAALLTGHDANRTGVWHTIAGRSLLLEEEVTIADVLKNNGYQTGIFGKWHLGDNYPFRPQDRGFQEVLIHGGGGVGQQPDYWFNDYFDDTYLHNGIPKTFKGYCTDIWFENAIAFMKDQEQKKRPFFCYLATNAPHGPFNVSDTYSGLFIDNPKVANPAFNGMIKNVDDNIGKLTHFLDSTDLADNTILIFMTDNGTAAGVRFNRDNGQVTHGYNAGMRGTKGSMYEGGHRVPFFIRWPKGNLLVNADIPTLSAHIDVFPTLMNLIGIQIQKNLKWDGVDLSPILKGEAPKHNTDRILITDSQRLEKPEKWRQSAVMKNGWRLINGKQLYNLQLDPGQKTDIASQNPAIVKELSAAYNNWWQGLQLAINKTPQLVIGHTTESSTTLNVHDLHMDPGINSVPWNNHLVRKAFKTKGWYAIQVEKTGWYDFHLYRWPKEIGVPITAGVNAVAAVEGTNIGSGPIGKALPIKQANISIADQSYEKPVDLEDTYVAFRLKLDKGVFRLRASFQEEVGQPYAANYVEVRWDNNH